MALTDIISDIGEEAGYKVVTSNIANSQDTTTKQLYKMANRLIAEMMDAYNWPVLHKTATISLTEGSSTYALPADFSRYHHDTFWNSSEQWKIYGPLTQQEYALRLGYGEVVSVFDEFQIRGMTEGEILIYPTPGAGTTGNIITFQYTSARPVRPKTHAPSTAYTAGDYVFSSGVYYIAQNTGISGILPLDPAGVPPYDGAITWQVYEGPYMKFLQDTDICNLSERILSQGILERFAVLKNLSVQPLYEAQLSDEYAKRVPGKTIYGSNSTRGRFQHAVNGRISFGG